MVLRPGTGSEFVVRTVLGGVLAAFLLIVAAIGPAQAQFLPEGFFDMAPTPGQGAAAVEADRMSYDSQKGLISAEGGVVLSYQGYTIRADRVEYEQASSAMHAIGHVAMRDPMGNVYQMDSIEVTGGLKDAFINSLTLTTSTGSKITARDVHYTSTLITTLTDATYSPCGLCVDKQGRRIGWKVKATKITYDREHAAVYLDQPSLEVLGIPVAWLPWFWIPDPTQPRATGIRLPTTSYEARRGIGLAVPYFVPVGNDIDILLSPTLLSRQGLLLRGDVDWRFPGLGEIDVTASGLYQFDKAAYAGLNGERDWRGAIQTAGRFTPTKDWTVGWSYSVFTDNGYLADYALTNTDTSVNQVYATYLTDDSYLDVRLQHFNNLDDSSITDDPKQANALPVAKFSHVQDLAPGYGRVNVSGELLSVVRGGDQYGLTGAVPYVYGYESNKQHLELEGAWESQWILPGGVTATPYLGMRLDATNYDRTGAGALPAPYPTQTDASLLSATPIAAMDFRWPWAASDGANTQMIEPVAQLVYRGSSTTAVGITNDDAQSFVFDTSNLFSYNHFSGIDRQDTGLRANLGAHYLGTFADGSWLELVAGQSFHLLGPNALGVPDAAQVGTSTGLGSTASYIVASAQGGLSNGIAGSGKIQVDPAGPTVTRATGSLAYSNRYFSSSVGYSYIAADPLLGTATSHDIAVNLSVPIADYWNINGGYSHSLVTNSWTGAYAGAGYDDGFFAVSGSVYATPTSNGFTIHAGLKGPEGSLAF